MTNAIAAQRISLPSGRIGFFALTLTSLAASSSVASTDGPLALGEEEEHESEQSERLGERDTEEHRRADRALHLGLARHGLDRVADDEADADARADGRGAVHDARADRLETGLELTGLLGGEKDCGHDDLSPGCVRLRLVVGRWWSGVSGRASVVGRQWS